MRGSATVLLIEDNPAVADASAGLLEQLGYTVRWASSAEAALSEVDTNGVDVVFSDIVMPGRMDGLKLARAIRDRKPELPILLTTGYSESARDVRSDFPVLRKPYRIHDLSRELSKLTGQGSGGATSKPVRRRRGRVRFRGAEDCAQTKGKSPLLVRKIEGLAFRRPASPHQLHPLDAAALLAAVLENIPALGARRVAALKPHRPDAADAGDQRQQWAAIVIHRCPRWRGRIGDHGAGRC